MRPKLLVVGRLRTQQGEHGVVHVNLEPMLAWYHRVVQDAGRAYGYQPECDCPGQRCPTRALRRKQVRVVLVPAVRENGAAAIQPALAMIQHELPESLFGTKYEALDALCRFGRTH